MILSGFSFPIFTEVAIGSQVSYFSKRSVVPQWAVHAKETRLETIGTCGFNGIYNWFMIAKLVPL